MAQHLWLHLSADIRLCEVCHAWQPKDGPDWPRISPICPGDDGDGGRRVTRRHPNAPAGGNRVLEVA